MTPRSRTVLHRISWALTMCGGVAAAGCQSAPPADRVRVSGQIEATEIQVSSQVAGRLLERRVAEGTRVAKGDIVATLDTQDTELALTRARAERDQAEAQ